MSNRDTYERSLKPDRLQEIQTKEAWRRRREMREVHENIIKIREKIIKLRDDSECVKQIMSRLGVMHGQDVMAYDLDKIKEKYNEKFGYVDKDLEKMIRTLSVADDDNLLMMRDQKVPLTQIRTPGAYTETLPEYRLAEESVITCSTMTVMLPKSKLRGYEVYLQGHQVGYASERFRPIRLKCHPCMNLRRSYEDATSAISPETASSSPSMVLHQTVSLSMIRSMERPCAFEPLSVGYKPDIYIPDDIAIDFCGEAEGLKMKTMIAGCSQRVKICLNKYKLIGKNSQGILGKLVELSHMNDKKDLSLISDRLRSQTAALDTVTGEEITSIFDIEIANFLKDTSKVKKMASAARVVLKERMMRTLSSEDRNNSNAMRTKNTLRRMNWEKQKMLKSMNPKSPFFLLGPDCEWRSNLEEPRKHIWTGGINAIVSDTLKVSTHLEEMRKAKDSDDLDKEIQAALDRDKSFVAQPSSTLYEEHNKPLKYFHHENYKAPDLRDIIDTLAPCCIPSNVLISNYLFSSHASKIVRIAGGRLIMRIKDYSDPKINHVNDSNRESLNPFSDLDLIIDGLSLHPMHECPELPDGARAILSRSRDYHEALIRARVATAAQFCRRGKVYKLKQGYRGVDVFFYKRGNQTGSDGGSLYVSYYSYGELVRCEKWRNSEIPVLCVAPDRMVSTVSGLYLTLRDVTHVTLERMALLYCRIIAERSWGLSKLLKPFRYLVTGHCFDSPLLLQQFRKFREEFYEPDKKKPKPEYDRPSVKMLLELYDPMRTGLCPLTSTSPSNLGYSAFLMNLCPSDIYGKRRHAVNTSLELFSEIDLADAYEPYVRYLHGHFKTLIRDPTNDILIREHFDMIDELARVTGGRFTFSPMSVVLIRANLAKLVSSSKTQGTCPALIDLCTTRASFDSSRAKNTTAMEAITSLAMSLGSTSVFDCVKTLLTEIEWCDLTFRMFPKDQIGGDREISIMESQFRVLQSIVEAVSKRLGSESGVDYLANPKKIDDMCSSYNRVMSSSQRWMFTGDQTRWGPNFNTVLFSYMFISVLDLSTELYLPAVICAMSELKVFQSLPYPELVSHMKEGYTLPGRVGKFHMGQGIFHYTSSLYHSMVTNLMGELLSEIIREENQNNVLFFKPMITSDDVAIFMSVEGRKAETDEAADPEHSLIFSKFPNFFRSITTDFYRYFSIKSSDYKNSISPDIVEFNSIFLMANAVGSNSLKFLYSLIDKKTKGDAILDYSSVINTYSNSINSGLSDKEAMIVTRAKYRIFCSLWRLDIDTIPFPKLHRLLEGTNEGIVLKPEKSIEHRPVLYNKTYERLQGICDLMTQASTGILMKSMWSRKTMMIKHASRISDAVSCTYLSQSMISRYRIYDRNNGREVSIPAACILMDTFGSLAAAEEPLTCDVSPSSSKMIQILGLTPEKNVRVVAPPAKYRTKTMPQGFSIKTLRLSDRQNLDAIDLCLGKLGTPELVHGNSSDQEIMLHIMRNRARITNLKIESLDMTNLSFEEMFATLDDYLRTMEYSKGNMRRLEYTHSEDEEYHQVICPIVSFDLEYDPILKLQKPPISVNLENSAHYRSYVNKEGELFSNLILKSRDKSTSMEEVKTTLDPIDIKDRLYDEISTMREKNLVVLKVKTDLSTDEINDLLGRDKGKDSQDEFEDEIARILAELNKYDVNQNLGDIFDTVGTEVLEDLDEDFDLSQYTLVSDDDPLNIDFDLDFGTNKLNEKFKTINIVCKVDSRVKIASTEVCDRVLRDAIIGVADDLGCLIKKRSNMFIANSRDMTARILKRESEDKPLRLATVPEYMVTGFDLAQTVRRYTKEYRESMYRRPASVQETLEFLGGSLRDVINHRFMYHLPFLFNVINGTDIKPYIEMFPKERYIVVQQKDIKDLKLHIGTRGKVLIEFNNVPLGEIDTSAPHIEL